MSEVDPPIVTWLRDPDGNVWAIDAADVMTKAPDAEPARTATWDELVEFIPADTMMAAGAHFRWHMRPLILAALDALPLLRLWQQRDRSRLVTRRKQRARW